MSSITKTLPRIRRHPEAMYVKFAEAPCQVSLEVADNFVVDFSPDDDIVGLEILWEDTDRDGSEPALLAFGMFAAAIVWLGYHHSERAGQTILRSVHLKVRNFIAGADLPMRVSQNGQTGLTIKDDNGKPLLCADLQDSRQGILRPEDNPSTKLPSQTVDKIRSAIDNLANVVLSNNPGAVGVAVFINSLGSTPYCESVPRGKWVTWPEATKDVRTHIAVIPPQDRTYPWLPDGFISTQT